jgi:hypothetical protein
MSRGPDHVLAIYGRALPRVYGYLLPRCGDSALAAQLIVIRTSAATMNSPVDGLGA